MEICDRLFQLRKEEGLSQEELASRLHVTRQAVSRWEQGITVPSVDTLQRIASVFRRPVDELLGNPAGYCQSCGMELRGEEEQGTEADGNLCADYCIHCYQRGRFTRALTMEEQAEENLRGLAQWNRAHGLSLTEEEAREQLLAFLATLNRWRQE